MADPATEDRVTADPHLEVDDSPLTARQKRLIRRYVADPEEPTDVVDPSVP